MEIVPILGPISFAECVLRMRFSDGNTANYRILVEQLQTVCRPNTGRTDISLQGVLYEFEAEVSTTPTREELVLQNQPGRRCIRLDPDQVPDPEQIF